jgi:hypothetical protein
VKIFGFWTFWVRPPHVWVVAPALEEPKVLRENTEKVVIFLKNAILGRRWAPVCVGSWSLEVRYPFGIPQGGQGSFFRPRGHSYGGLEVREGVCSADDSHDRKKKCRGGGGGGGGTNVIAD